MKDPADLPCCPICGGHNISRDQETVWCEKEGCELKGRLKIATWCQLSEFCAPLRQREEKARLSYDSAFRNFQVQIKESARLERMNERLRSAMGVHINCAGCEHVRFPQAQCVKRVHVSQRQDCDKYEAEKKGES